MVLIAAYTANDEDSVLEGVEYEVGRFADELDELS